MIVFLSRRDLHRLTGSRRPGEQAAWLKREKFLFRLDVAKRPVVMAEEVRAKMSTPVPLWTRRPAFQDFEL
jgi:hypothetical protein